jgi:hypothetical protein
MWVFYPYIQSQIGFSVAQNSTQFLPKLRMSIKDMCMYFLNKKFNYQKNKKGDLMLRCCKSAFLKQLRHFQIYFNYYI